MKTRKRGRGRGGMGWSALGICFLMPAKQRNINKSKLAVKREGKLTHGTHIHAGNGIMGPGEGGMRGRDGMRMGMVVKKKPC